jgi:dipeptidyl aminopeptidase/acylaminoacyl peptidase
MAERIMSWADPRRLSVYRKALALFQEALALAGHRAERVEIPYEGKVLSGYLRLPEGDGPHPAIIFYNGFDSIKEMHYQLYADDAALRGIAVLFIDQEGTGEAMRLHGLTKRVESEIAAGKWIDYLETRAEIASDRIGVAGISNGGYDAPRAAAFEKRFTCAACLGAFYNAEDYMGRFEGHATSVTAGLSNLDDHMLTVTGKSDVREAWQAFAERDLGGVLEKVTVPLLVLHGENDRQVPLWHAERTVAEAVNSPVTYKVFTLTEGSAEHCGIDNAGMHSEYLFDWAAGVLGGRTVA